MRSPASLLLASLLALVSCGEPQAPPASDAAEASSEPRARQGKPAVGKLEAERIEQLSAIGYVSGSTPAGPLQGVTTYDAERAHQGFNFFTSGHAPVAILMDMEGNVLHEWRAEFDDLFPGHPRAPGGISPSATSGATRSSSRTATSSGSETRSGSSGWTRTRRYSGPEPAVPTTTWT